MPSTKAVARTCSVKKIVYKKTDVWYVEWQRMRMSDTTSDKEWQRVVQRMKTNENKSKRVILGLEWNKICSVQLQYIQECKLFINWEIDDIHFQYTILCFYHASISSCFSRTVLSKLLKHVKLIVKCECLFENIM